MPPPHHPLLLPPTTTQQSDGLGPHLSTLPPELRTMILSHLIASGHPTFMQASRALYLEGRALIFHHGIYRMYFGSGIEDNGAEPSPHAFNKIKKFEVEVDLRGRGRRNALGDAELGLYMLGMAGGKGEGRKCEMKFWTGCVLELASEVEMEEVMGLFKGFEEVRVRVVVDKGGERVVRACECEKWLREGHEALVQIWRFLEPVLGKADFVKEEGGFCLVYRPGRNTGVSTGLVGG